MALFENYERRIEQINKALKENGVHFAFQDQLLMIVK